MRKYRPLNGHVVIKTLKKKEKKIGNILVVDETDEIFKEGIIVDFCDGSCLFEVGDRIIYGYGAVPLPGIADPEYEFSLIKSDEIYAIFEEIGN